MGKLITLIALILSSCLLGGLYGILHDQLTYTISPEYYTKFKFYQFGLMDIGNEAIFPNPRIEVSFVGFLATWWMGLPIGITLGLVGLIHKDRRIMFAKTFKSFFITIIIAFVTGLTGLVYGYLFLADKSLTEFPNWYIPDNLINFDDFIAVGSMHNFSYIGGLIGLVGGLTYTLNEWRRLGNKREPYLRERMASAQHKL